MDGDQALGPVLRAVWQARGLRNRGGRQVGGGERAHLDAHFEHLFGLHFMAFPFKIL